jgi:hypothetical protein
MTYRELIYIILDQFKISSDDSYITEDHVLFLANKVRALLLKQRYSDVKKDIPLSNYQTITVSLEEYGSLSVSKDRLLKSIDTIPTILTVGKTYVGNGLDHNIALVSRDRFQYTGVNKWLRRYLYATIDVDNYLYIKSGSPRECDLSTVELSAIFEDPTEAASYNDADYDYLDDDYPLEEGLITSLLDIVVKYISGAVYQPTDPYNNANDDLSSIQSFIRQNMKDRYLKDSE